MRSSLKISTFSRIWEWVPLHCKHFQTCRTVETPLLPHLHPAPPDSRTLPALPPRLETTTTRSSLRASWSSYGHTWALFHLVFLIHAAWWPGHGRLDQATVLDLSLSLDYTLTTQSDQLSHLYQYSFSTVSHTQTHDYIDHYRGPGTKGRDVAAITSDYF